MPDCDPPDVILILSGRVTPFPVANDSRPLRGLVVGPLVLETVDDTEDCRPVRDAGMAGGPIDVRVTPPPTDGLAFAVTEGTLAFDGVAVRDVEALDAAVVSCLVGDFVGDLRDPG